MNLNAPVILDGVNCYDTEAKLTDCDTYEYGTFEAYCNVAAGVMCEGSSVKHIVVYTKYCMNYMHVLWLQQFEIDRSVTGSFKFDLCD